MEGANQTVVIGSQFCSPQPLQLSIKKKVYFCAGHGYQVKDGYGNFVFTIENLLGFFSSKVLVFDAADIPILTLKSKMNKNYTAGSIFLGRDKFMVKVNPNVDYAFIVSLIVILEEIVQVVGNIAQNNSTSVQQLSANGNSQQNNDNGGRQIVPVETVQQIQTTNKFAALQVEDESNAGNQLAIVEEVDVQNTPNQKELNPAAVAFTPKSTRVASSKRGKEINPNAEGILSKVPTGRGKESTAQWVNRTFPVLNVISNQSCQDIPSQSLDTSVLPEQENLKDRVEFVGSRLWDDQQEEESDEGEFLEGHEDVEEVQEKDLDVEEQSVNGKSGRVEAQSVDDGNNIMASPDQPLLIEQQNTPKSPSNSNVQLSKPIAQTKDTGDPGGSSKEVLQQQSETNQKEVDIQHNIAQDIPADATVALTQIQKDMSSPNPEVLQKKNNAKKLIPKSIQNQFASAPGGFGKSEEQQVILVPECLSEMGNLDQRMQAKVKVLHMVCPLMEIHMVVLVLYTQSIESRAGIDVLCKQGILLQSSFCSIRCEWKYEVIIGNVLPRMFKRNGQVGVSDTGEGKVCTRGTGSQAILELTQLGRSIEEAKCRNQYQLSTLKKHRIAGIVVKVSTLCYAL
ncbi:hypothetical protein A4A49_10464 [Nicotiana attenuata]|uniref:Uncharacterized protein n=1 Tax=Nicotiana attenuata TaxID=49451 RepID=A0A1J6IRW5_NICAT|nr:hypothetical protein A4A49_10464 [Nicotiana attenuata]